MEKHEKILASKVKTIRTVFAVLFFVVMAFSISIVVTNNNHEASSSKLRPNEDGSMKSSTGEYEITPMKQNKNNAAAAKVAPKLIDPAVEELLVKKVQQYDQKVRDIKANLPDKVFMETDPTALAATHELQAATRDLLYYRYGHAEPYRIRIDLVFQESNPTTATMGTKGSFTMELGPSKLVPHSIYTFLEIARHFHLQKGAFHRRANHVLQAMVHGNTVKHLAFQEYSPDYPHVKGTVGYAGRPSGPGWYVSIMDNSRNHGPGSQQSYNPHEADACIGKVVEGFEDVVLKRITKMPGSGFLKPPAHVLIDAMTILVPNPDFPGEYIEWHDPHRPTK